MIKPYLKWPKSGISAMSLFLILAGSILTWIILAASKNPADSGESGILLLPFAMPWIMVMPDNWLGLWTGLGCLLLNSVILLCLFGGLRFKRPGK